MKTSCVRNSGKVGVLQVALTLFAKFFAKTFIKNPSLWFWPVFFILFMLTIVVFALSRGYTKKYI